jgi:hypothetical protein
MLWNYERLDFLLELGLLWLNFSFIRTQRVAQVALDQLCLFVALSHLPNDEDVVASIMAPLPTAGLLPDITKL